MRQPSKCILISLDEKTDEIKDLAISLNFEVKEIFIQNRNSPNPGYFIGTGKVEEIKEYITENDIDLAIINSDLKPSQQFNLEKLFEITVFDRIRLILEIFADRAHSEEARLQVELAKMQYEIPLLRDWIHKARYSEKPGFMAGGEYEVAQYYEISRKRIKKIKQKLKKVEKERDIRRKQRRKLGYFLISVVGYTNAGKSTLFNLITGEKVTVEDRLFSTLSTTTRKVPLLNKPALLTDTVGLIDNLPHWIIDAFHSTLEEIFLSDVILLILDISEPITEINRKLKTSFNVLLPDINPSNIILVLNKVDKLENVNNESDIKSNILNKIELDHSIKDIIYISAIDKKNKNYILEPLIKRLEYSNEFYVDLPNKPGSQSFINWLYTNCEVISIEYKDKIKIHLKCREKDKGHITMNCNKLKGKISENNYPEI